MNRRITPAEREAILAQVDRLALKAERFELEHDAKRGVINTSFKADMIRIEGSLAGHRAVMIRRKIQELLASLYQ